MPRPACVACLFWVVGWTLGCGSPQVPVPPTTAVKGTVSLDGKPMSAGEVRFSVAGMPPTICPVKDGVFSGEAFLGKNKVNVALERDGPPSTTIPKTPTRINTVAHKDIEAEVAKDGANDFKFKATSAR